MKLCVAIAMAAGCVVSALPASAQSRLEYQVSLSGAEDWHSSLDVAPGTAIDVRARISYMGTRSPLGLGSVIFQPTISNWLSAPSSAGVADEYVPVPAIGWSVDGPGVYGKMHPYSRTNAPIAPTDYVGHHHTISGTSYLRIALPQVTSWFGGSGNTTGGSGVLIGQVNRDAEGRPPSAPFGEQIVDAVMFKFQIVLGAATDLRTLTVDTPVDGFGNRQPSGVRTANWFANYTEPTGSIREAAFAVPAFINVVPAPGACLLLGVVPLIARRRR